MKELIYKKDAIKALTIYLNYVCIGLTGEPLSADKCRDAAEGVIGQLPPVQPVNADLIQKIEEGIKATTPTDEYSVGMRNGMKWCKSLLDGKEPEFDIVQPKYKKRRR